MHTRNAHATGLRVEPGREGAERVDATANSVLRLEDYDIVSFALELEATHESGQAATNDDHTLAALGPWSQAMGRNSQHLARYGRRFVRRRLGARIGLGLVRGIVGHDVTLPRP